MAKILTDISRTFSEFLLLPRLTQKHHTVSNVSLKTPISRHRLGEEPRLSINIPFTSAAMQSVSGTEMAIGLARQGGLSFIFSSQAIDQQAAMIEKVKSYKSGFVISDSNVTKTTSLRELLALMKTTGHSTVPVTSDGSASGVLEGIITDNDVWEFQDDLDDEVSQYMTPIDKVIHGRVGVTLREANELLHRNKKECLPILDEAGRLDSLVFKKDYVDHIRNPLELVDKDKRLIAGAAVNTHDYKERIPKLMAAGVDVLCFDSSDGFTEYQGEALAWARETYGDQVVLGAGNVVSAEGFRYLAERGADFVKIGIGGGSICITREQKGIGRGQASSVLAVVAERDRYAAETGIYIPLCSDGGLANDTQIIIALAMGADFVMLGRYFAMTDESPTPKISLKGQFYKPYWGEGSNRARNWQRYSDDSGKGSKMLFEEGVDAYVPIAGSLAEVLQRSLAKLRSTMTNCGALSLAEFVANAILTPVSQQSFQEGGTSNVLRLDKLTESGH